MNALAWPKRLYALDVSRGFASLAVILWHWQHFAFRGRLLPADFDRTSQPFYGMLKIFYENGDEGVSYFFVLSGFIFFWIYLTKIETGSTGFTIFWVQRFSRLYPLHFVTLLLVAILQMLYTRQAGNAFVYPFNDAYHFLLNLGFASRWGFEEGFSFNAPVWSVSIEILLYALFFIIARRGLGRQFVCYSISLVAFAAAIMLAHKLFLGIALFFAGGFVFHVTVQISMLRPSMRRVVYAAAVLSWSLTIVNYHFVDLAAYVLRLGIAGAILLKAFTVYVLFPATICALALLEIERGNLLRSISWLGDITYSSYLLHFPLQLVLGLITAWGLLAADFYLAPLALLLFFAVLIAISYATYVYFERPAQNLIRRRYGERVAER